MKTHIKVKAAEDSEQHRCSRHPADPHCSPTRTCSKLLNERPNVPRRPRSASVGPRMAPPPYTIPTQKLCSSRYSNPEQTGTPGRERLAYNNTALECVTGSFEIATLYLLLI